MSGLSNDRKRPGRPFPKGQSGNPGGRTRELRHLQTEIERIHAGPNVLDAIERIRQIGMGTVQDWDGEPCPVGVQLAALQAYVRRIIGAERASPVDDQDDRDVGDLEADEAESLAAQLLELAQRKRAS